MSHRSLARVIPLLLVGLFVAAPTASAPGPDPNVQGVVTTVLSDGQVLVTGGQSGRRVSDAAILRDPATNTERAIRDGLRTARVGHTATVLGDGTVLIFGGVDARDRVLTDAELYDPATQTFAPVATPGLAPRARHTATLLTDGRVLLAGGLRPDGTVRDDAEVWDPHTGRGTLSSPLSAARRDHTANLLSTGAVLLSGGVDGTGTTVARGDSFDPATTTFTAMDLLPTAPFAAEAPALEGSLPATGTDDVPTDAVIALRFSKPLRPATLARGVTLTGPAGVVDISVVAAEGGRLVFVTPGQDLEPGAAYTLAVDGLEDTDGRLVPLTFVTFVTAGGQSRGHADHAQHANTPGHETKDDGHDHHAYIPPLPTSGPSERDEWEWKGRRRDGQPYSPWQDLRPLHAPPGVTALSGQVLRLNGLPLAEVTLQVGARSTRTDRTGRFLLTGIVAGTPVFVINGATANQPGRTYGSFVTRIAVDAERTTVLPFTIWMPLMDTAHATALPVPTPAGGVVAKTPRMPGLEIQVPGHVVLRTGSGPLTSIMPTRIPVDRPPFPLPPGTDFFFTPQTHGALVVNPDGTPSVKGVRMLLPNYAQLAPGVRLDLMSYVLASGQWESYGRGTVSRDGTQIVPDPGVEFHRVTCIFVLGPTTWVPPTAPPPGGNATAADPVDLATGLFTYEKVDLVLPDVIPIVLRRTYRTLDGIRFHPFGYGSGASYQLYLVGDTTSYQFAELILSDGARIRYNRTSAGTDKVGAVMAHTATPTGFFKSTLFWNATRAGWEISFKDGTAYEFPGLGHAPGPMLTAIRDRQGNRLVIQRDDSRLITRITSPNGRWVAFTYDGLLRATQVTDSGGRTLSYTYDSALHRIATVTDAAGGVTTYTHSGDKLLTITDPRGITYLTHTYDAAGRVATQTLADGTIYQFAYTLDANGKIIQTDVTNPRGFVRRVTFNAGRLPADGHAGAGAGDRADDDVRAGQRPAPHVDHGRAGAADDVHVRHAGEPAHGDAPGRHGRRGDDDVYVRGDVQPGGHGHGPAESHDDVRLRRGGQPDVDHGPAEPRDDADLQRGGPAADGDGCAEQHDDLRL
jgi:YD repeat-containing protein